MDCNDVTAVMAARIEIQCSTFAETTPMNLIMHDAMIYVATLMSQINVLLM